VCQAGETTVNSRRQALVARLTEHHTTAAIQSLKGIDNIVEPTLLQKMKSAQYGRVMYKYKNSIQQAKAIMQKF